jgi:hypothetical protein
MLSLRWNSQLLDSWRDTVRAAELAERLAADATEASHQADIQAEALAEIADLADKAADAAARAAGRARSAAREAADTARRLRHQDVPDARARAALTRQSEVDAAAAYHLSQRAGEDG